MRSLLLLLAIVGAMPAMAGVRVAVVPFDNAGGAEFDGLSVGLQSMVVTDLSQAEAITVVERARLQDLLQEMQLATDGVVDPSTAVEIGKVSGATHVVAGSFTVMGDQMRLDARVADVQTGQITAAAEQSGEREAFFELEKALVKDLLVRLGAELSPRERAAVGRLHTADFDSFARFSEGVALFDADRYDEAIAVLQSVSTSDEDFKLALVTLDDVKSVQRQAEEKARAARVAAAEEAFVVHQERARAEADVLDRLLADARDPKNTWQQRATANVVLVTAMGANGQHGGLSTLRKASDAFALRRAGERAYQAFWNEVRPRVPEWFPKYRTWHTSPMNERYTYEEYLKGEHDRLFVHDNPNYRLSECQRAAPGIDDELAMLWLPRRRELEERKRLLLAAKGCMEADTLAEALFEVAEAFGEERSMGDATALLRDLSDLSTDERFLQKVAREAAENTERQADLDRFPVGTPGHELVAVGRKPDEAKRASSTDQMHSDLGYYVRSRFDNRRPLFVGGVPTWSARFLHSPEPLLSTGPRSARDETGSVRHYAGPGETGWIGSGSNRKHRPGFELLVIGGVPRRDGTARVSVDFRPADDFYPLQRRGSADPGSYAVAQGRPTAGLLLAVREIDTEPVCDPVDPTKVTPVPLTAVGVLVHEGQLVVAEVAETYPEPDSCTSTNFLRAVEIGRILGSKPLKGDGPWRLVATVQGRRVTAQAGKTTVEVELPTERSGFVALFANGEGYVELSEPALE